MKKTVGQLALAATLGLSSQVALSAWTCGEERVYPHWPQVDWQGTPSHAIADDHLIYGNNLYRANWYTSALPGSDDSWAFVRDCTAIPDEYSSSSSSSSSGGRSRFESYWVCPGDSSEYPNWPQNDWQGNPHHANTGDKVHYENRVYEAKWYTSSKPGSDNSWRYIEWCTFVRGDICYDTNLPACGGSASSSSSSSSSSGSSSSSSSGGNGI